MKTTVNHLNHVQEVHAEECANCWGYQEWNHGYRHPHINRESRKAGFIMKFVNKYIFNKA